MAILLRIYTLAEFNRFGLARENVIAEIVDYLREAGASAEDEIRAEMENESDPVSAANPKSEQDFASFFTNSSNGPQSETSVPASNRCCWPRNFAIQKMIGAPAPWITYCSSSVWESPRHPSA